MATETYNIKFWYVGKEAQGKIPDDGFKQDGELTSEPMLGGPARKLTWPDQAGISCSMSLPSDKDPANDVEVHFGHGLVSCRVELRRYGKLLVGALTCGSEGLLNDGNAGIFVAEAILPEPVDSV